MPWQTPVFSNPLIMYNLKQVILLHPLVQRIWIFLLNKLKAKEHVLFIQLINFFPIKYGLP